MRLIKELFEGMKKGKNENNKLKTKQQQKIP